MWTPPEVPFLRAIFQDPAAESPRLVYADWLQREGGPDGPERAEFLRTDLALDSILGPKSKPQKPGSLEDPVGTLVVQSIPDRAVADLAPLLTDLSGSLPAEATREESPGGLLSKKEFPQCIDRVPWSQGEQVVAEFERWGAVATWEGKPPEQIPSNCLCLRNRWRELRRSLEPGWLELAERRFSLILLDRGPKPLETIKAIRAHTGWGLLHSKQASEAVPKVLTVDEPLASGKLTSLLEPSLSASLMASLCQTGAEVRLEPRRSIDSNWLSEPKRFVNLLSWGDESEPQFGAPLPWLLTSLARLPLDRALAIRWQRRPIQTVIRPPFDEEAATLHASAPSVFAISEAEQRPLWGSQQRVPNEWIFSGSATDHPIQKSSLVAVVGDNTFRYGVVNHLGTDAREKPHRSRNAISLYLSVTGRGHPRPGDRVYLLWPDPLGW